MERFKQPYFSSLIVYLYLFSISNGEALPCSPSSCGQITDIHHPFRLKSDPSYCGSTEYELLCKENKTILQVDLKSYYYVTDISYMNGRITVVDPNFVDGNCTLPFVSHRFSFWITSIEAYAYEYSWGFACFMKCTVEIHRNDYLPVRCLQHQGSFVYAVYYGYDACYATNLEPSCSFLGITSYINDEYVHLESSDELFQVLQKGFFLHFRRPSKLSDQIYQTYRCIKDPASSPDYYSIYNGNVVCSFLLRELECIGTNFDNFFYAISLLIFVEFLQLTLVLIVASRFVFAPLSILVFMTHKFWMERVSIDSVEKFLQMQERLIAPKRFAYTDIIALTSHFREKLGQGGFGSVYKGKLINGQKVAIKMLGISKINGDEFINEVSTLGRIHHVNVVHLMGYCAEGSKRALVYEYMSNGSLDKYIFTKNGTTRRVFSWNKINEMALGVARGIDYLHRGCDMQILHFDIKPHNILLDENFNPKISDFGLAKLYPRDCCLVSVSAARGTVGYIAPELVSRSFGVISYKSDVYSFGMLLLEMAGGRRNAEPRAENASQIYYPSWIYEKLMDYEGLEIDRSYEINSIERKLCLVGLWCIQMKSFDRPQMSRVVEMLEGDADGLQIPPPPFFSSSSNNPISDCFVSLASPGISAISEEEEISLLDD